MDKSAVKYQLFTAVNPTVLRIVPELAVEIGLNESIVLMQISFWIGNSNNVRDGVFWTYQSLRKMHKEAFPYWSIATIRRTVQTLADAGYILVGNYNKRSGDNTQWFALEPEKISSLKSVVLLPVDSGMVFQNETGVYQNETPPLQNETTLPETTTETTPDINHSAQKRGGKKKRSSDEAIFREAWAANAPIANALLTAFGNDFVEPERQPRAALASYLEAAQQFAQCGASSEEMKPLHTHVTRKANAENWTIQFGPLSLVKHYPDFLKTKSTRPAAANDLRTPVDFKPVLLQHPQETSA